MMEHHDDLTEGAPRPQLLLLLAIIAALGIGVAALLVELRTLLLVTAVIGVGLVKGAMALALKSGSHVWGVLKLSAGNYGGRLGKYRINLRDIL